MMRRSVARLELIGLEARVVNSSDPGLIGLAGRIVDETRNMLVVECAGGDKMVPKAAAVLRITLPSGEEIEVDGAEIVARPEERIKGRG